MSLRGVTRAPCGHLLLPRPSSFLILSSGPTSAPSCLPAQDPAPWLLEEKRQLEGGPRLLPGNAPAPAGPTWAWRCPLPHSVTPQPSPHAPLTFHSLSHQRTAPPDCRRPHPQVLAFLSHHLYQFLPNTCRAAPVKVTETSTQPAPRQHVSTGTEAHPRPTVSSLLAPSAARPGPHHPQPLSRTGLGIQTVPTEKGARTARASPHSNQAWACAERAHPLGIPKRRLFTKVKVSLRAGADPQRAERTGTAGKSRLRGAWAFLPHLPPRGCQQGRSSLESRAPPADPAPSKLHQSGANPAGPPSSPQASDPAPRPLENRCPFPNPNYYLSARQRWKPQREEKQASSLPRSGSARGRAGRSRPGAGRGPRAPFTQQAHTSQDQVPGEAEVQSTGAPPTGQSPGSPLSPPPVPGTVGPPPGETGSCSHRHRGASEYSRGGHGGEGQLQGWGLCGLGRAGLPAVQLLQLLTELGIQLLHRLSALRGGSEARGGFGAGPGRVRRDRQPAWGCGRDGTGRGGAGRGMARTWPVGSSAFCRASSLEGATRWCRWRSSRSTCRCTFSFLEEATLCCRRLQSRPPTPSPAVPGAPDRDVDREEGHLGEAVRRKPSKRLLQKSSRANSSASSARLPVSRCRKMSPNARSLKVSTASTAGVAQLTRHPPPRPGPEGQNLGLDRGSRLGGRGSRARVGRGREPVTGGSAQRPRGSG